MKRSDLFALTTIVMIAAGLRLWAPWDDVLGGARVNFLETDAWYHVRLVENQVRHFPHRVTVDPYAAPDGQFVAVAPLFDALVSTAVFVTRGPNAPASYIERVAALAPPIMGVLAVVAVWALAAIAFDRRAALMAALLVAILPGHFLDRTLVGFVDHHALEVLLSFSTLAAFAAGAGPLAGVCLGLYLLAWSSGAFFVAILAAWVALTPLVGEPRAAAAAARSAAVAAVVALVIVLLLQNPALFRYNTQLASLGGLLLVSAIVLFLARRAVSLRSVSSASSAALELVSVSSAALVLLSVLSAAVVAASVFAPDLVRQVVVDLSRFRPDPTRMAVLEARPLFLYSGNWNWLQPWIFFRTGFYLGAVALIALAISLRRSRRLDHLLMVVFTASAFAATVGQNRFGYYLVPATAVVIGWLSIRVLDWGGVPHAGNPKPKRPTAIPFQREAAVILVAGLAVAPNIVPAALTTTRAGNMSGSWAATMDWLRTATPPPFESDDYYYARYRDTNPAAGYTIMNWWDQGYWIIQAGRRVPVSNPTQARARNSAAFYTATDEAVALRLLSVERSRYVLVDWELPFRDAGGGALGGRFQNLADWAGTPTSEFYSLCYSRTGDADAWQPVWLFREAYYRTMVYRMMVLGGAAAAPVNQAWLVQLRDRSDVDGRPFCEVTSRQLFASADEARAAAATRGPGSHVVGLNPWQPAFPIPALTGLRVAQEFREAVQQPSETPMVRIFEVVGR